MFSLRYKLLLLMIALLAFTVSVYMISTIKLFNEDKTAYTYENNAALVSALAAETETSLQSIEKTMRLISLTMDQPFSNQTDDSKHVQRMFQDEDNFVELTVYELSPSAKVSMKMSNLDYLKPFGLGKQYLDQLRRERPIPLDLVVQQQIFFQNTSLSNGPPLLTMAIAVDTMSGHKRVLAARLRQDLRLQMFSRSEVYRTYLIDAFGNLLVHTDSSAANAKSLHIDADVTKTVLSSQFGTGVKEYADEEQNQIIMAYSKLKIGNLFVISEIPKNKAFLASQQLIERTMMFAVLVFAVSIMASLVFTKKLLSTLRELYLATLRIGQGDFTTNVKSRSRDELGSLAQAFNQMAAKIVQLLKESVEKARMEKELETAQLVQDNFFPTEPITNEYVDVHSYYAPASECGGDWFSYFINQDKLYILIGDATGHGVPAALITAAAQSCWITLTRMVESEDGWQVSPKNIMDKLNAVVYGAGRGKVKMTFFVAAIDLVTGMVDYTNASHDMPILGLLESNDGQKNIQLRTMAGSSDPCLGAANDTAFTQHQLQLREGEVIAWYTDGLIECRNSQGEEYGEQRLLRSFKRSLDHPTADMCQELIDKSFQYFDGVPRADDIALILVKFKKSKAIRTLAS